MDAPLRKIKGRSFDRPVPMLLSSLCGPDVFSLKTFWAFHDFEGHGLTFLEATEAIRLYCREMHEDILAIGAAQKAESLRVVKPLNCSLFHFELVPSFE